MIFFSLNTYHVVQSVQYIKQEFIWWSSGLWCNTDLCHHENLKFEHS